MEGGGRPGVGRRALYIVISAAREGRAALCTEWGKLSVFHSTYPFMETRRSVNEKRACLSSPLSPPPRLYHVLLTRHLPLSYFHSISSTFVHHIRIIIDKITHYLIVNGIAL